MQTEDALRQFALRLVSLGVQKKTMAAHMGAEPWWISRWLRQIHGAEMTVIQMDAFYRYIQELAKVIRGVEHLKTKAARLDETGEDSLDTPHLSDLASHTPRDKKPGTTGGAPHAPTRSLAGTSRPNKNAVAAELRERIEHKKAARPERTRSGGGRGHRGGGA